MTLKFGEENADYMFQYTSQPFTSLFCSSYSSILKPYEALQKYCMFTVTGMNYDKTEKYSMDEDVVGRDSEH